MASVITSLMLLHCMTSRSCQDDGMKVTWETVSSESSSRTLVLLVVTWGTLSGRVQEMWGVGGPPTAVQVTVISSPSLPATVSRSRLTLLTATEGRQSLGGLEWLEQLTFNLQLELVLQWPDWHLILNPTDDNYNQRAKRGMMKTLTDTLSPDRHAPPQGWRSPHSSPPSRLPPRSGQVSPPPQVSRWRLASACLPPKCRRQRWGSQQEMAGTDLQTRTRSPRQVGLQ